MLDMAFFYPTRQRTNRGVKRSRKIPYSLSKIMQIDYGFFYRAHLMRSSYFSSAGVAWAGCEEEGSETFGQFALEHAEEVLTDPELVGTGSGDRDTDQQSHCDCNQCQPSQGQGGQQSGREVHDDPGPWRTYW
ncbi:MAG: hypothetical protein L0G31_09100 [Kocuria sp.]|nr:hypothetical protein [Kocuria sp.]